MTGGLGFGAGMRQGVLGSVAQAQAGREGEGGEPPERGPIEEDPPLGVARWLGGRLGGAAGSRGEAERSRRPARAPGRVVARALVPAGGRPGGRIRIGRLVERPGRAAHT